jgi:hypothetical protein
MPKEHHRMYIPASAMAMLTLKRACVTITDSTVLLIGRASVPCVLVFQ